MKQKIILWFYQLTLLTVLLLLSYSCKKADNNGDNNNQTGTVTDSEGNIYRTVTIGTQMWMAENLRSTKFIDGSPIPMITDSIIWGNLTSSGFCWYNNDSTTYKNPYGALYNGYTISTGKLGPSGWHVPTQAEWSTLITYLGGEFYAGGKMKESGTKHWVNPNVDATNESGFTAVPGGNRWDYGSFYLIGTISTWWSTTTFSDSTIWICNVDNYAAQVFHGMVNKKYGFSVRCLKN